MPSGSVRVYSRLRGRHDSRQWACLPLLACFFLLSCGRKSLPAQAAGREASFRVGFARLQVSDLRGAEEAFREYLAHTKPLMEGVSRVLLAYQNTGQQEAGYDFLMQLGPQIKTLRKRDQARFYQLLGDLVVNDPKLTDKALAAYETSYQLNPNEPLLLNNYGYTLADRDRDLKKALQLVTRAVDIQPDSGIYRDSLGWVYYKLGQYERACSELKSAVELEPRNAEIRYHLAAAFYKLHSILEAKVELEKALALDPGFKPAKQLLTKIQEQLR